MNIKEDKKTRMLNMVKVLLGIFSVSMILSGCGISPFSLSSEKILQEAADAAKSDDEDTGNLITVGVSQIGSESSWRTAHTESIQAALTKENGFFMIFNNARQKQENQIKAIRSFISRQVDYIVISPVIEDGWETVLAEAKAAGIPVILMDRSISVQDESLYTSRVGIDATVEGEKAGLWLEEEMKKRGMENEDINIVVIHGTTGSSSQRGRTKGFNSISRNHTNWHVIDQIDGDFTTSKGKEAMEQLLEKYDDIDVIVSQNDDMTIGALEALNKAGIDTGIDSDVILISFDATRVALDLVAEGVINVDVECNPNQGEYVSEIIKKLENNEPVEKVYIVDEKVFTIDNVNDYLDSRTY